MTLLPQPFISLPYVTCTVIEKCNRSTTNKHFLILITILSNLTTNSVFHLDEIHKQIVGIQLARAIMTLLPRPFISLQYVTYTMIVICNWSTTNKHFLILITILLNLITKSVFHLEEIQK